MSAHDLAPPARASLPRRLAAFLRAPAVALSSWNDARLSRKVLGRLSLHELADLGLNRGDLDDLRRR